ncbi:MAG: glycosyltransferase family 2 protein [Puniceicoccales bacterium]|jgi:succinoglycan biosynthesis protein ExoM|nr:glycosyltransferase family 2 protein [Puniceicoccales bacterium]
MEDSKDRIVIGLCTFNRHEPLKEALDSLSQIDIPETSEIEFVLVDNDGNGEAKYIFNAYAPDMPFKCHYFVEKNRGLAHVRNRVIEEALKLNATAIAMFDDDEIVAREWLVELYKAFKESGSDGVAGTVYRLLPTDSSNLVKKLWPNSKEPANISLRLLPTNNCLFSTSLVDPKGGNIRFNNAFNFSGREDLVFSFDAIFQGAKFTSAPQAIVIEKFSKGRSTFKYLLKRWFDTGVTDVIVARHYGFGVKKRTSKEILSITWRCLILPFLLVGGAKPPAVTILYVTASLGWLCGLFGKKTNYYFKHID